MAAPESQPCTVRVSEAALTNASAQFLNSLAPGQKDIFEATIEAGDFINQVLAAAQSADTVNQTTTHRRIANKLGPLVAAIDEYGQALDVLAGTFSLALAPLWAGIRVILITARRFGSYFDRIAQMLEDIGYHLPRVKRYLQLYPDNATLHRTVADVYAHIFSFCGNAMIAFGQADAMAPAPVIVPAKSARGVVSLSWTTFKQRLHQPTPGIGQGVSRTDTDVVVAHNGRFQISAFLKHPITTLQQRRKHKPVFDPFRPIWGQFRQQFQETQASIETGIGRIEDEADIAEKEVARKERVEDEDRWRQTNDANTVTISYVRGENIRKLDEWLSPVKEMESIHEVSSDLHHKHPETGKWFLNRSEFQQWIGDSDVGKFMWLSAMAGAGKTILVSTIINCLKQSATPGVGIAYFYCDYNDVGRKSPVRIFGTLLAMLAAQNENALRGLQTVLEEKLKTGATAVPTLKQLSIQLTNTSQWFPKIFVVLDGLDECDIACREDLMNALLSLSQQSLSQIKVLIASRNESDIHDTFYQAGVAHFPIEKRYMDSDIESYITTEIGNRIRGQTRRRKLSLLDPSLEQTIITELLKNADGMFQWAKCQIDVLSDMKCDRDIKLALKNLPKTLHDTYVRILQRLVQENGVDVEDIRRILKWLVNGVRSLTLDELAEVHCISRSLAEGDCTVMDFERVFTDLRDILDLCGCLVAVSPDSSEVTLAHYSIKEFLVSDWTRDNYPQFYFGSPEVDGELAKICLTYLSLEDFNDGPRLDCVGIGLRFEKYHFLKYAALSWAKHTHRYKGDDQALLELTLRFLRPNYPNFVFWRQVHACRGDLSSYSSSCTHQPFYYASLFGLSRTLEALIGRPDYVDLDDWQENEDALQAAALEGHTSVVQILVTTPELLLSDESRRNGMVAAASRARKEIVQLLVEDDVRSEGGGEWRRALVAAAITAGDSSIVHLLMERYADAASRSREYGEILLAAAEVNGGDSVLKLLRHSIKPNIPDGWYKYDPVVPAASQSKAVGAEQTVSTAVGTHSEPRLRKKSSASRDTIAMGKKLMDAVCNSRLDEIRLLVSQGADVNGFVKMESGYYWSPLQYAACQGFPTVVDLLLELHADVNLEGGKCYTALQAIVSDPVVSTGPDSVASRARVFQALLDSGADVNLSGGEYASPLAAAAFNNRIVEISVLLEHGANVNDVRIRDKNTYFRTCLQEAVRANNEDIVELLIQKGADINLVCPSKWTGNALEAAAAQGHEKTLLRILELGATLSHCPSAPRYRYGGALTVAARWGKPNKVRILIGLGSDVNAQGGASGTPLQGAALAGCCESITLLLDAGADINASQSGMYGTALQAAVAYGQEKAYELLIKRGADINRFGSGSKYGYPLIAAAANRRPALLSQLIKDGADLNAQRPPVSEKQSFDRYFVAIHAACAEGCIDSYTVLRKHGAKLTLYGGREGTAIHAGYRGGWIKVVLTLLNSKELINVVGGYHGTALCSAIYGSCPALTYRLLAAGANPNLRSGRWGPPLAEALRIRGATEYWTMLLERRGVDVNTQGGRPGTALHQACLSGSSTTVQQLLDLGADINARACPCPGTCICPRLCRGTFWTPLIAAANRGRLKLVQLLVKLGAHINIIDRRPGSRFGTALQCAAWWGHSAIVTFLLDHDADINAAAGRYWTALHAASLRGHETIVSQLVARGADIHAKGGKHGNALIAASLGGHMNVVEFLIKRGVDVNSEGGRYGNALQSAVLQSWTEIAELLISKGAKQQANLDWWKNAPLSRRKEVGELAERLLGIKNIFQRKVRTGVLKPVGTGKTEPKPARATISKLHWKRVRVHDKPRPYC